ncbi:Putative sulfatase (fragment) [Candidatus Sulfopaludibacter sp. SbA3]
MCRPFRGSLLTSRYPHHCVPGHEYPAEGPKTIADVCNANGYRTAGVGKWRLSGWHQARDGRLSSSHHRSGVPRPGYETDEFTNLLLSSARSLI